MVSLLVLATLVRMDPSGDAHGAGNLLPPTAAIFSSSAPFDLTEVSVLDRDVLTLRVGLADRSNPGELPNGVTLPVIDLYLDTEPGGEPELLPGPGLRMPDGQGWEIAVRVTGDRAFARRSGDAAAVEHAVSIMEEDGALVIATPFAAPERASLHAVTGVYDPFGPAAWRPLAREASPWSFSSEDAAFPVVDVLAEDDAAQRAALESGVLPAGRTRNPAAPWLVLMILGLLIAAAGLVLRSRVGRSTPEGDAPTDGESVAESEAAAEGEAAVDDDPFLDEEDLAVEEPTPVDTDTALAGTPDDPDLVARHGGGEPFDDEAGDVAWAHGLGWDVPDGGGGVGAEAWRRPRPSDAADGDVGESGDGRENDPAPAHASVEVPEFSDSDLFDVELEVAPRSASPADEEALNERTPGAPDEPVPPGRTRSEGDPRDVSAEEGGADDGAPGDADDDGVARRYVRADGESEA